MCNVQHPHTLVLLFSYTFLWSHSLSHGAAGEDLHFRSPGTLIIWMPGQKSPPDDLEVCNQVSWWNLLESPDFIYSLYLLLGFHNHLSKEILQQEYCVCRSIKPQLNIWVFLLYLLIINYWMVFCLKDDRYRTSVVRRSSPVFGNWAHSPKGFPLVAEWLWADPMWAFFRGFVGVYPPAAALF